MRTIIDFHVHPYLTEEENLCMYREDFSLTAQEAVLDIKNAGISHICGSVLCKQKFEPHKGCEHLRELNREALKIRELYPDFYTPGFHIHPGYIKESLEEIEYMHARKVKLIGELVPYMHGWRESGYDYGCGELSELLDLAGKYGMIVSFHTMTEQQDEMERMIAAHPDVIFVAAHPGQKGDYLKHLERLLKYENAYLDISGTGLFRYGMLAAGVKRVGAEKILFGTDYPITNPSMYVQAVLGEHISEEDREKIFYRNAGRILEIEQGKIEDSREGRNEILGVWPAGGQ